MQLHRETHEARFQRHAEERRHSRGAEDVPAHGRGRGDAWVLHAAPAMPGDSASRALRARDRFELGGDDRRGFHCALRVGQRGRLDCPMS